MGVSSIDDGGEVVGEGSRGCLGAVTHLASMDQTARKPGACDAEPKADAAALAPARGVDAFFFFAFVRAGRETRDARWARRRGTQTPRHTRRSSRRGLGYGRNGEAWARRRV